MNSKNELTQKESASRRKFVFGVGILSMFTAFAGSGWFMRSGKGNAVSCSPGNKTKIIKMLSQDGKLVEIDASMLSGKKEKVTDKELQNWIKKRID